MPPKKRNHRVEAAKRATAASLAVRAHKREEHESHNHWHISEGSQQNPIILDDDEDESDCGYQGGVGYYSRLEDEDEEERLEDGEDALDDILQEIDDTGLLEHDAQMEQLQVVCHGVTLSPIYMPSRMFS